MPESAISLPHPEAAPRCAPWSREQRLVPAGTAIRADQVLLLDVPAPWPKPIKDHPRLSGMMDVVAASERPTRLFAAMPADDRIRLTVFRNVDGSGVRSTYVVGDESRIPEAIDAAASGTETAAMTLIEAPAVRSSLLVCTQGTHDICCGSDGVRFSGEVERRLPAVDIYRVSHTGGHRFAPTAMTMPDGRMWAWLDVDDVQRIVDRSGDHSDLAARCRGWWGAEQGPKQAAEVAVFAWLGWDSEPRAVSGRQSPYEVDLGDRSISVHVEQARTVPTISCRSTGGLPTKPAAEYTATVV